jgi:RNA binding exosome subunit
MMRDKNLTDSKYHYSNRYTDQISSKFDIRMNKLDMILYRCSSNNHQDNSIYIKIDINNYKNNSDKK